MLFEAEVEDAFLAVPSMVVRLSIRDLFSLSVMTGIFVLIILL
jgi:hypothetical protein